MSRHTLGICLAIAASCAFAQGHADSPAGQAAYDPSEIQYIDVSAATKAIAEPYFDAYIRRDWDAVEPLLGADSEWFDPTAAQIFGGVARSGRGEIMAFFRKSYAGITDMRANVMRRTFSSNYAIFEATLDWSVKVGKDKVVTTAAMPFLVILKVVEGKVVEHRDYGDYRNFIEEFRRVRAPG